MSLVLLDVEKAQHQGLGVADPLDEESHKDSDQANSKQIEQDGKLLVYCRCSINTHFSLRVYVLLIVSTDNSTC